MVFLALTRKGHDDYQRLAGEAGDPLWLSAGVFSNAELMALRRSGVIFSDFNYVIKPSDKGAITYAVETMKEHHPHETIWIEA